MEIINCRQQVLACHGGHELTNISSSATPSISMQQQYINTQGPPLNSQSSINSVQQITVSANLGADYHVGGVDDDDDDDDAEEKNMTQELSCECSMCGHVGLAQYLFKCLSCSSRFQHTYCSKLYPYRMETSICNWCLPLKLEFIAAEDQFHDHNRNYNNLNSIDKTNDRGKELNSKSDSFQQVKQKIEKRSKAFEYLLQIIAELADGRCHWLTDVGKDNNKFTKYVSSKIDSDVHHNGCGKCSSYKKHTDAKSVHHASLVAQQNNMFREVDHESKLCFYTRRAEAQNLKLDLSATSLKRPCSVRDSCQPKPVTVIRDDDQFLIKRSTDQIENCTKLDSKKTSGDRKVQDQNLPPLSHSKLIIDDGQGGSLSTGVPEIAAAARVVKRPRSNKKQCVAGDDCTISNCKANEGSAILTLHKEAANLDLMDLRFASNTTVAAVENDDDELKELYISKQISSPVSVDCSALTQKRPGAAGHARRDQLTISSPSRAMNRRYKLLADVLC